MSENKGVRHGQTGLSPRPSGILKDSNRANLPGSSPQLLKVKQPSEGKAKGDGDGKVQLCQEGTASPAKQDCEAHQEMARDILDQLVLTLPLPESPIDSKEKVAGTSGHRKALTTDDDPFQTRSKIPNSPQSRSSSESSESEALADNTKQGESLPCKGLPESSSSRPARQAAASASRADASDLGGLDDMLSALASLRIGDEAQSAPAKAGPPPPLAHLAPADAVVCEVPTQDSSTDTAGSPKSGEADVPLKEEHPAPKSEPAEDSAFASMQGAGDEDAVDPSKSRSGIPSSPALDDQGLDDSEISLNIPAGFDKAELTEELPESGVCLDSNSSEQAAQASGFANNSNGETGNLGDESAPENLNEESATGILHDQATEDSQSSTETEHLSIPAAANQLANSPAAPEADPFKPKSQLANSPAAPEADPFKPKSQLANSPAPAEGDPFQPKTQLANSPGAPEGDPFKPKTQLANSPAVPEANPFKPKTQLANSPVTEADPFKPKSQLANSPAVPEADPFKPKSQLANSPAAPEADPFKPKTQLANSPAPAEGDPFKPKSQLANSPAVPEGDPFQPKSQLANSPAAPEADPFQPKTQLANSPAPAEGDPFQPKSQLANSPAAPEADPFQPKTQLANSPAVPEANPFKPKTQLANSPVTEADPFKPKSQLANSPAAPAEADPFKPKSQLANSPAAPEADPFKPKTQLANSPAPAEGDPFQPKSQLANSPAVPEADPFQPKSQLANSPLPPEADPFQPKTQLANSPAPAEGDPFQPKSQLANSPAPAEGDPFKPKSQLANSPAAPEGDPFKPKTQLANSPVTEADPFKPKSQLANSPGAPEGDPFKPKTQLANSPAAPEADPFKPKSQLANSPLAKGPAQPMEAVADPLSASEGSSASVAPDLPSTPCARGSVQDGKGADVDLMVPFTPMPSISAAAESKPQPRTELDRLLGTPMVGGDSGFSQQGLLTDQQLSLSDEVFVPASEVFKDSSTWEMLEKFGESGKKKENDLARMSLYVKFDPLVQASRQPGSPRAGSTRSASARGKMDQSQDQSMMEEESILLMGTPPRNRGKHRSMMSHLRGNQNVSVVQRDVIEEEQAVDQFFSCSPAGDLPESQTCGVPTSASATDLAPVLAYTEAEMEEVKRALELAHQGELMKREGEWSREREALKKSCTKAKQELCKAHQDLAQIRSVIPEYEKVIESLIAEKEKADEHSKEEVERLKQERDSALEDVRSLEQTCSDVMKRYEKLRAIADGQKKNEEVMRKAVAADREKLKISEENCLKVKKAAEEKLAKQVEELQKAQSALAAESARREAAQRRIQSLEKALQQKDSENRELTQICDSLIAKTAT